MDFQESSSENIVVGITFQWENTATLGGDGTENMCVCVCVFLSSHLLIFFHESQKTLSSGDLQLNTTKAFSMSRNFDMSSVKHSLYTAWVLQLTVDILDLRFYFGFSWNWKCYLSSFAHSWNKTILTGAGFSWAKKFVCKTWLSIPQLWAGLLYLG